MLIKNYFEDLSTHHINTMPRRNYFIPYSSEEEALNSYTRRDSSYYFDLNGVWDFYYFNNVREIEGEYWLSQYKEELDYESMKVPSVWQLSGYGQIQYTNTDYPIPFDPPHAPYENPAGLYHREFKIKENTDFDYHLNFEGVDAAFYVWVNDEFIGYSQISHSNTEFDLTSVIKQGKNTLSVLVVQWGDMTYLEDQDKFRYSGIFRDVYLLKRNKKRFESFRIHTDVSKDLTSGEIELSLHEHLNVSDYSYSLINPTGEVVASGEQPVEENLTITIEDPALWNAEKPNLYQLIIDTGNEVYLQKVGLRTIYIDNSQIQINHQPIFLVGVNHHDTHPETGATVTLEDQRRDLELMKELNFNAIRTAHYPKTAEFYELCDEMGFYVMSEADLEAHGVVDLYGLGGSEENYNMIAEDEVFNEAIVDRMDASIVPFINYTSIFMWSAGNESGYGVNLEDSLSHAREIDPSRLLHYEGYWERDRDKQDTFNTDLHDVWSRMYANFDEMDELYFSEPLDRPFILCEYIHAMGNGPGDVQDYHDYMLKHSEFAGGFVWEWADHAVNINRGTNHKPVYRYGGDFGEYPHAGNFCMDGLMYPDRTPHTGAFEHKQVFRPVLLTDYSVNDQTLTFKNRYAFSLLNEKIDFIAELYDKDGQLNEKVKLDTPAVEPYAEETNTFEFLNGLSESIYSIRIVYKMKNTDIELGFDTITLKEFIPESNLTEIPEIMVDETVRTYTVQLGNRKIVLSKVTGAIDQLYDNKRPLLKEPSNWTIWRAPIDNDRRVRTEWEQANYHLHQTRIHTYELDQKDDSVKIRFEGVINAVARHKIVEFVVEWTITKEGEFSLELNGQKPAEQPFLPRFGLRLPLDKDINQVSYFGNGPYESYPDKHQANYLARFGGAVEEFYEPYVTPQENGSRDEVRQLKVYDEDSALEVTSSEGLSFNVSHYSVEQLTEVPHRDKLVEEPYTYLHLDYQHSGSGSNACGPELLDEYRLNAADITFKFNFNF